MNNDRAQNYFMRIMAVGGCLAMAWLINIIWYKPFSIEMFFERFFWQECRSNPELMTSTRAYAQWPLVQLSGELKQYTPETKERNHNMIIKNFEMLRSYKVHRLAKKQALSAKIMDVSLEREIFNHQLFPDYGYPIDHIDGVHVALPLFMTDAHYIHDLFSAEEYIHRLGEIPLILGQVLDVMRFREGDYFEAKPEFLAMPPKYIMEKMIAQARLFAKQPVEGNIIYQDFVAKLEQHTHLIDEAKRELHYEMKLELEDAVMPAFAVFANDLELLLDLAPNEAGVGKYEMGSLYYEHLLKSHITLEVSPDSIEELGDEEYRKLKSAISELLFSMEEGAVDEQIFPRVKEIYTREGVKYPNSNTGRIFLVEEFKKSTEKIEAMLDDVFPALPHKECTMIRMNPLHEPFLGYARYIEPSFDFFRPGKIEINLHDLRDEYRPLVWDWVVRFYYPGRHLQSTYLYSTDKVPKFRKALKVTAFTEGWEHYATEVAEEQGVFDNPLDLLGKLHEDLIKVAKLKIDIGLHFRHWSREEAIANMIAWAGISERRATAEVDECIVRPGKNSAYIFGYYKILELKARAKQELGDKFDDIDFHKHVLSQGAMPLGFMDVALNDYLERKGAKPKAQAKQAVLSGLK